MFKRFVIMLFLLVAAIHETAAQQVSGSVRDAETARPLRDVLVYFSGNRQSLVLTDSLGRFALPYRKGKLVVRLLGYQSQVLNIRNTDVLLVDLVPESGNLQEVEVVVKRKKYSRRENPAVELMRRVIAAKQRTDPARLPYLSYRKYEKLTTSLNDLSDKALEGGFLQRLPSVKGNIEKHPFTGKLTLPLILREKVSQTFKRRYPSSERTVVEGERQEGVLDFMNSGELLGGMMEDAFQDVNVMDNSVRLFQHPFLSPVSDGEMAIRFYRYFIVDTLDVDGQRCIQVDFLPNNPQDFGFSGSLYVLADSSDLLHKAVVRVPARSGINYVDDLLLTQRFQSVADSLRVLSSSEMLVQMSLTDWLAKVQVERVAHYHQFRLEALREEVFLQPENPVPKGTLRREDDFWLAERVDSLTCGERGLHDMLSGMSSRRWFKPALWVGKMLVENYVETSFDPNRPSLFDLGPINTFVGSSRTEGFRLRVGGQTTAALHPHWFAKGYVKYGFGDRRWKGMGELVYSFNAKERLPQEFPRRTLSFSYRSDVGSFTDRFMHTDVDNVFFLKQWSSRAYKQYYKRFLLAYDWELDNGLRLGSQLRHERSMPTGDLVYQPLNGASPLGRLTYSEVSLHAEFQPGATYVNTKQHRLLTNQDHPRFSLTHTMGFKGFLGGDFNYQQTEAGIYKRFWLYSWGKMNLQLNLGAQWSKVPFPLLCMPASNLSYIVQNNTFSLVDNMEFLNDRYVSFFYRWDMNGKIFNRVPLLRRLKWREVIGCNVLWGTLTDKNNALSDKNGGDDLLFRFPCERDASGMDVPFTHVMNKREPYVELLAGVHNIFNILRLEYVYRLNYHRQNVRHWGVRGSLQLTF